ncbi:hypothetical protein BDW74DRAFT_147304 [Aspergillus multicolor]|uniref:uncharacterized protein n=1 Tax=Aspergillus multicolor TaxID=41759 RepID=UPI003CCDDE9D
MQMLSWSCLVLSTPQTTRPRSKYDVYLTQLLFVSGVESRLLVFSLCLLSMLSKSAEFSSKLLSVFDMFSSLLPLMRPPAFCFLVLHEVSHSILYSLFLPR